MLKSVFLAVLLFLSTYAYSQVNWLSNFQSAQAISLNSGKFILLDFWAQWCGPCRVMDQELWNSQEMTQIADQFVPVKVDIDQNHALAGEYRINSIPRVIIVDVSGNVIWDKVGYRNANDYLEVLKNLPADIKALNESLLPFLQKKETEDDHLRLAYAYQQLGKKNAHYALKDAFFDESNKHFKKIRKMSNSEVSETAELNLLLNDAYRGNYKRALKKLSKTEISDEDDLQQLSKFIQAYCYKCKGEADLLEALLKDIHDEAYLSELK